MEKMETTYTEKIEKIGKLKIEKMAPDYNGTRGSGTSYSYGSQED